MSKLTTTALVLFSLWGDAELTHAQTLVNPSFESGGIFPEDWQTFGSGLIERWDGDAYDGSWCARLGDHGLALIYQRVAATAHQEYQVQAYARRLSGNGEASLKVEFHNANGQKLSECILDFVATHSWIETKVRGIAPAATTTVTASLVAWQGGEILFDLVRIDKVPSTSPQLVFDRRRPQQQFQGFGSQIWGYNAAPDLLAKVFADLNLRWARIENHDETPSWAQMQATRQLTDAFGVEWIGMVWSAPSQYRSASQILHDPLGFAQWWADHVEESFQNGVPLEWIELMNEPDSGGLWSTGITPTDYNTLLSATRAALDAKGLTDVGILGPGLAAMSWTIPQLYFDALDATARESLDGLSTHPWTDDRFNCQTVSGDCLQQNWQNFVDRPNQLGMSQPLIVTEHGSKETDFFGETYPSPDEAAQFNATHSMGYAVRAMEDTLALLNAGAEVILHWYAVDDPSVISSNKGWGFLDLDGNEKPVYVAAKLLAALPEGGFVLAPPDQEFSPCYATVATRGRELFVAVTNTSDGPVQCDLRINGVTEDFIVVGAQDCVVDHDGDPLLEDPDTAQLVATSQPLVRQPPHAIKLPLSLPPLSLRLVHLQARGLTRTATQRTAFDSSP